MKSREKSSLKKVLPQAIYAVPGSDAVYPQFQKIGRYCAQRMDLVPSCQPTSGHRKCGHWQIRPQVGLPLRACHHMPCTHTSSKEIPQRWEVWWSWHQSSPAQSRAPICSRWLAERVEQQGLPEKFICSSSMVLTPLQQVVQCILVPVLIILAQHLLPLL